MLGEDRKNEAVEQQLETLVSLVRQSYDEFRKASSVSENDLAIKRGKIQTVASAIVKTGYQASEIQRILKAKLNEQIGKDVALGQFIDNATKLAKEDAELAELEREMGFLQGQDRELNEIAGKMGLDYSSSLQSSNIKLIADIITEKYINKSAQIPEKVFEEVDKAYGAAKREKELHISRDQFKSALGLLVAKQLGLIRAIEVSDKPAAEKAKEKEAATTQAKQLIKVYIQAIKEGRTSYIGDALLLMREYGLEQEFKDTLDGAVKEATYKEAAGRVEEIPDKFSGIPLLKLIEAEEKNIRERNELILKQKEELESIKKDSETIEKEDVNSEGFKAAFKRMMADKRDSSSIFQFVQTAKKIEKSLESSKSFTASVLPHASPEVQKSHPMLQEQREAAQVDQQIKSRIAKRIIYYSLNAIDTFYDLME